VFLLKGTVFRLPRIEGLISLASVHSFERLMAKEIHWEKAETTCDFLYLLPPNPAGSGCVDLALGL
jgi:hypothetical protein